MVSVARDVISPLRQRYEAALASTPAGAPFELRTPDGNSHLIGNGEPSFVVTVANERGLRALSSFDEISIAEAYMGGDIDIEGSMLQALKYRAVFTDNHPLHYLWVTYASPLLGGQVRSDKKWIKSHYDVDAEFFVLWLDRKIRGYSHGFFEDDSESLETGMERKFRYAMDACGIKPGDRVLDIGGGWGSFMEFAGTQGVEVTSLTISDASLNYMQNLIREKELSCRVVKEHFLEYEGDGPYDAIVNLGVTEHLPDYRASLQKYLALLKPGGRLYLDASAQRVKHSHTAFLERYVFPGNGSLLCLHEYLAEVARTPFQLLGVYDDRHSYHLTAKAWAERLDRHRETIERRWGKMLHRRFQLYLWGSADGFRRDMIQAYRLVLRAP